MTLGDISGREHTLGIRTAAIHAGQTPDPCTGASAPDLVMSTTFVIDPEVGFSATEHTAESRNVYTRWGNPTVAQLEHKLAVLEGTEDCVCFASGMAAVTALLLHTLKGGSHIVMSDVTYAATSELANDTLPGLGIEVTRVDTSDPENIRAAMRPNTALVFIETPVNPLLRLTDIEAAAQIAHEGGARLAVDSTFATPIGVRPMDLGADFVVHSLTKYICGHGDAIGGSVAGRREDMAGMRSLIIHTGGILSPFNAWLILRGAATLPIRMAAHEQTALAVAQHLESHPAVIRVIYPGLPSHPQHDLAVRQMKNFSGMVTFQTTDGPRAAQLLSDRLQIVHYAVSLGHHRSLVCFIPTEDMMASSFHLDAAQEASYRKFAGDGLFRLSVGLEDAADIIADIDEALAPLL